MVGLECERGYRQHSIIIHDYHIHELFTCTRHAITMVTVVTDAVKAARRITTRRYIRTVVCISGTFLDICKRTAQIIIIIIITIIIIAEMAVFNVAGYLIAERRRWPVITASPRGQYYKSIQNLERNAHSDEKTVPVAWLD